jgi:hypothetical protein
MHFAFICSSVVFVSPNPFFSRLALPKLKYNRQCTVNDPVVVMKANKNVLVSMPFTEKEKC